MLSASKSMNLRRKQASKRSYLTTADRVAKTRESQVKIDNKFGCGVLERTFLFLLIVLSHAILWANEKMILG